MLDGWRCGWWDVRSDARMDCRMYGIMNGRKDVCMNGNMDGTMFVRIDGRIDLCKYGRVEGRMENIFDFKILYLDG